MLANNVHETSMKKYLLVSKSTLMMLKGYSKSPKVSLKYVTEHLIAAGLKYAVDRQSRKKFTEVFMQKLPGFQYVISQGDKKYLVVSVDTHQRVKVFARKEGLKLTEATRCLIFMGLTYTIAGDPKQDPRFKQVMEISQILIDHWGKQRGISLEQYYGPGLKKKVEDHALKVVRGQNYGNRTMKYPTRYNASSSDALLRDISKPLYEGIVSEVLEDNKRLKAENERLRSEVTEQH